MQDKWFSINRGVYFCVFIHTMSKYDFVMPKCLYKGNHLLVNLWEVITISGFPKMIISPHSTFKETYPTSTINTS